MLYRSTVWEGERFFGTGAELRLGTLFSAMLLSLSHSPGKTHLSIYVLSVGQLCFEVLELLILCSSTPTYLVKRAGVVQNLYKSLLALLDAKYRVAYQSQISTSRDPSCLSRKRWLLLLLMGTEY
jgi:hypothetical protein